MRNPFMFHIQVMYIYRFYLRHKNKMSIAFNYNLKLSVKFIYKYLHLYSIVFMSARKKFRILEVFEFQVRDIRPVVPCCKTVTLLVNMCGEVYARHWNFRTCHACHTFSDMPVFQN
jgi:hypothetical protein